MRWLPQVGEAFQAGDIDYRSRCPSVTRGRLSAAVDQVVAKDRFVDVDGLAATVCEADPRTRRQRRADALGAPRPTPPVEPPTRRTCINVCRRAPGL